MPQLSLTLLLFLLINGSLWAQGYYWQSASKKRHISYVSVEGGGGLRMYFGDIQQPGQLFNKPKLGYQVGVRYQMRPRFGVALQLGGRSYQGNIRYAYPGASAHMDGKLWEGQLVFQFNWLKWEDFTVRMFTDRDPVTKLNSYLGAGFGGSLFNASYSSNYISSADTLVAEYEGGSAGGFGIYVPVEFGVRYRFNPRWSIGMELQYHIYFTNNIDALASKERDAMGAMMFKLGYSFGQRSKKGQMKVKRGRTR